MKSTRSVRDKGDAPTRQSERPSIHICIFGVYGKGNLGDELILRSIREEIASVYPTATFTAFCSAPEVVTREHGIFAVSRKPLDGFFSKLRLIRSSDLFIIGGGTLLRDGRGWLQELSVAVAALFWPIVAKLHRKPTMAYGQGVGPAQHWIIRSSIRRFFSKFDAIALRDGRSTTWVAELGGNNGSGLYTTCDPVVTSPSFSPTRIQSDIGDAARSWLDSLSPYIAIALRRPEGVDLETRRDYFAGCARAIAVLYKEARTKLLLVPVQISDQYPDDRAVVSIMKDHLISSGVPNDEIIEGHWESLELGAALFQRAELVISDRLHALLLAAIAGVGIVSTSSDDKIKGCLEMIGLNDACASAEHPESRHEKVEAAMLISWRTRKECREKILEGIEKWRRASPSNLDIVNELLHSASRSIRVDSV